MEVIFHTSLSSPIDQNFSPTVTKSFGDCVPSTRFGNEPKIVIFISICNGVCVHCSFLLEVNVNQTYLITSINQTNAFMWTNSNVPSSFKMQALKSKKFTVQTCFKYPKARVYLSFWLYAAYRFNNGFHNSYLNTCIKKKDQGLVQPYCKKTRAYSCIVQS